MTSLSPPSTCAQHLYGRIWLAWASFVLLAGCHGNDVLIGLPPATTVDAADNDATGGIADSKLDSGQLGGDGETHDVAPDMDSAVDGPGVVDANNEVWIEVLGDGGWTELPTTDDAQDVDGGPSQKDVDASSTGAADGKIGGDTDGSAGPSLGSCFDKCGQADAGGCSCAPECTQLGTCCSDHKFYCGEVISNCGDAICHPSEKVGKCTADCRAKGDVSCLYPKCPAIFACVQSGNCSAALACLKGCPNTSETCTNNCLSADKITAATRKLIDDLRDCSANDDCRFSLPYSTPTTCGDGWCSTSEEAQASCAADCAIQWCGEPGAVECSYPIQPAWTGKCPNCTSIAVSPAETCAATKCPEAWAKCENSACRTNFACYEATGSLNLCGNQYSSGSFETLRFCASAAGCFAPASQRSCQGKCGQAATGQPCSCSADCLALGNCCADFANECPDLTANSCGNKTCQPDLGETAASCPADCAATPCKQTGECPGNLVCCGAVLAAVCRPPAECKP